MTELRLRPACAADARLLWEWANDPVTRKVSFSTEAIPWETHQEWLRATLADPRIRYFIAVGIHGDPVAQIRFEVKGDRAVVSVSVAPEARGHGYGEVVLRLGVEELWRTSGVRLVDAYIKPDNAASIHVFSAAGYIRQADCVINGLASVHMTLEAPRAD